MEVVEIGGEGDFMVKLEVDDESWKENDLFRLENVVEF